MKEEFRWIKGFEGKYKVSNLGRFLMVEQVDSMGRLLPMRIKSTHKGVGGYSVVMLRKDGKKVMYLAHRLVAESFIPNPDNKPYVDHIDGTRNNNCVTNLRWVTAKENSNNPITYKRMVEATLANPISGSKSPYSRKISQYTLNGEYVKTYDSIGLAARLLNICYTSIGQCARGLRKSAGGFLWKYETEAKLLVNKGKKHSKGFRGKGVVQMTMDNEIINEYVSIKEASRLCHIDSTSITKTIRGEYKYSGGYKWKLKEQM